MSIFLRSRRRPPQPSAQSRPPRQRPPRPYHGLVCGRKRHPQTPLSSHVCPRKATSFAVRPLASYAAVAPLILPPHSLVRSKHPLKPPGRSNTRNSILAAFLRGSIHGCLWSSCGFIRGGSPGSPLTPLGPGPRQLTHSRHCESRQQVSAPLTSADEALSTETTHPQQSCDLVCGGGLRFRSPFSHTPQSSARIFLQRR